MTNETTTKCWESSEGQPQKVKRLSQTGFSITRTGIEETGCLEKMKDLNEPMPFSQIREEKAIRYVQSRVRLFGL